MYLGNQRMTIKSFKCCVSHNNFTLMWNFVALCGISEQKVLNKSKQDWSWFPKILKTPIRLKWIFGYRTCKNRSANAVWHFDSIHNLVKHKFAVSGAVDEFSHFIMWLKCSNNNRGNTSYNFLKNVIGENETPLQVRGDKESEDIIISKHMVLVRNKQCRGCIGDRSTHNASA